MRVTTVMQWRVAQNTVEREAAWMFAHTIESFEATLDNYISEIIKQSGDTE